VRFSVGNGDEFRFWKIDLDLVDFFRVIVLGADIDTQNAHVVSLFSVITGDTCIFSSSYGTSCIVASFGYTNTSSTHICMV
jgi:hypothetical protein